MFLTAHFESQDCKQTWIQILAAELIELHEIFLLNYTKPDDWIDNNVRLFSTHLQE